MTRPGIIATLIALAAFATVQSAVAQAPASVAQPASTPAYDEAKKAAEAVPAAVMQAIQLDLIWTGDLNAMPTGEFGKRSYEAVRAFQKRQNAADTGILLPAQRSALHKEAARTIAGYGFTQITENGLSFGYPAKLMTRRTQSRNGPHFSSAKEEVLLDILSIPFAREDFEALFNRLKTGRPDRKISYSLLKPEFFVISGINGGRPFYLRFIKAQNDALGFAMSWDPALSPAFERVAIAMAASMKLAGGSAQEAAIAQIEASVAQPGTPANTSPPAAPAEVVRPAGPPVPLAAGASTAPRTGIGTFISAKGDILTYASFVAGCMTVRVNSLGTGRVIAGDVANDIALVQLPSASENAVGWRSKALVEGETVSLLSSVSPVSATITALAGPDNDTRRLTLSQSGGGALIDADGALAGLAAADGSPTALKPVFVQAFLRAHGAEPPTKGGDPLKAVIPLTCTPGQ